MNKQIIKKFLPEFLINKYKSYIYNLNSSKNYEQIKNLFNKNIKK